MFFQEFGSRSGEPDILHPTVPLNLLPGAELL